MTRPITVNIPENIEKEFRRRASQKYGDRKGYLGKAFAEAIEDWIKKSELDAERKSLELLKQGIEMKKWTFVREELYER